MLASVAEDDSFKFGSSAASLRKEVASNYCFGPRGKTNAPTMEEGISALSELTGWKPSSIL